MFVTVLGAQAAAHLCPQHARTQGSRRPPRDTPGIRPSTCPCALRGGPSTSSAPGGPRSAGHRTSPAGLETEARKVSHTGSAVINTFSQFPSIIGHNCELDPLTAVSEAVSPPGAGPAGTRHLSPAVLLGAGAHLVLPSVSCDTPAGRPRRPCLVALCHLGRRGGPMGRVHGSLVSGPNCTDGCHVPELWQACRGHVPPLWPVSTPPPHTPHGAWLPTPLPAARGLPPPTAGVFPATTSGRGRDPSVRPQQAALSVPGASSTSTTALH